jgi:hypothetical protein
MSVMPSRSGAASTGMSAIEFATAATLSQRSLLTSLSVACRADRCIDRPGTTRSGTGDRVVDERRELSFFQLYSPCLVCVENRDADGKTGVGTAFHIGEGYLVTARHVVVDRALTAVVPYRWATVDIDSIEIFLPDDESIDLAILKSNFSLDHYMHKVNFWGKEDVDKVDRIEIGGHLDDWIDDGLVLMDVVMFGYPPIPLSSGAELVAVAGQINAVIDPYIRSSHPLFVVSPTPRGGFSGGPVLAKDGGWLIGVTTSSLLRGPYEPELGYSAALTVEPIWDLMARNGINPGGCNGEFMDTLGFKKPR